MLQKTCLLSLILKRNSSTAGLSRILRSPTLIERKPNLNRCVRKCSSNQSSGTGKPKDSVINITPFSALVAVISAGGVYVTYLWLEDEKKIHESKERLNMLTEAGLGIKNWTLTDQYGKPKSLSDFSGRWVMLYFGFCHCPDICPEELEKLVDVVKGIDEDDKTPDILPVFITLDPARDTVQYMHKYCKDFSPKLVGLTGTTDEVSEVAKSYKVYYSLGEKDGDGDYIVDHTICMYLINPDSQLMDVYQRRAKVEGIVQGSLEYMKEYHKLKRYVAKS